MATLKLTEEQLKDAIKQLIFPTFYITNKMDDARQRYHLYEIILAFKIFRKHYNSISNFYVY